MTVTEREISREQLDMIYEDFRQLEAAEGVPFSPSVRYQFTAEENGKIVGYVSGITEHKWFYLTDLWIEASHRSQGLGTRLLELIEKKAAALGSEHIYLWTAGPVNPKFYEKNGYSRFAVLENKFGVEGWHQTGFRKALG